MTLGDIIVRSAPEGSFFTTGDQFGLQNSVTQPYAIGASHTVSVWVRPNSLPASGETEDVWRMHTSTTDDNQIVLQLADDGAGNVNWQYVTSDSTSTVTLTLAGNSQVEAGRWYNIIGCKNGSTTQRLFVNAMDENTVNSGVPTTADVGRSASAGRDGRVPGAGPAGTDEFSISYNGTDETMTSAELSIGIANAWSIMVAVNVLRDSVNQVIFTIEQDTGEANEIELRHGGAIPGDPFVVFIYDTAGTLIKSYQWANETDLGIWQQLIITWNGTSLLFYKNGVALTPTATPTDGSGTMGDSARRVVLAANIIPTGFYRGNIHSMAIWNSVLGPLEPARIWDGGFGPALRSLQENSGDYVSSANLKHWYRLSNNSSNLGEDVQGTLDIDVLTNITDLDDTSGSFPNRTAILDNSQFDGDIHSVAIWDVAITEESVKAVYSGGWKDFDIRNSNHPCYRESGDLKHWFRFGQGSTTIHSSGDDFVVDWVTSGGIALTEAIDTVQHEDILKPGGGLLGTSMDFVAISPVVGDAISMPVAVPIGISNTWTISQWIKPRDIATVNSIFFCVCGLGVFNSLIGMGQLGTVAGDPLRVSLFNSSGGALQEQDYNGALVEDTWHNVIVTWDGVGGLDLILDGVTLVPDVTTGGTGVQTDTSRTIFLGASSQSGSTTVFWSGRMGHIGMWRKVLSTNEIKTIATQGHCLDLRYNVDAYQSAEFLENYFKPGEDTNLIGRNFIDVNRSAASRVLTTITATPTVVGDSP